MANRRQVLAGLLATGLAPTAGWSDAGGPAWLSAARGPSGDDMLCGIRADLSLAFQIALPTRGHAAAAHPSRAEAVAFARRPGTFAVVLNCVNGQVLSRLDAPEGRHFYGHGVFSRDGRWLFTTENDYEAAAGRIGVWDAANDYARVDEWASGGVGPHDIRRLPGTDVLVVANGGIETHPAAGRAKLNLPMMRPNLSYIDQGSVIDSAELPRRMHLASIRHLALSGDTVAFGLQWQGSDAAPALAGMHKMGSPMRLFSAPAAEQRQMQGYVGSIAFDKGGARVGITSPRGAALQVYDVASGALSQTFEAADICGLGATSEGFVASTGTGIMGHMSGQGMRAPVQSNLQWDNHLVALT
ncbi:DUF1513 domain-containing protein [Roseovarius aestuarii]|nr:DUF1513 domain-containing protein [Roseovarius aestuarii]